jgi:hypothetical protein
MTELLIPDDLVERLQAIAQRENRPVEAVLESLLEQYEQTEPPSMPDALEAYVGSLDTDLTDLSTTVRETMAEFYRKRHEDSA